MGRSVRFNASCSGDGLQYNRRMEVALIKRALAGLPVPQVRSFDAIGSSNDEALRWAERGGEDGALVITDRQTNGRGRLGRTWVTNPSAALAFSIILRPTTSELASLALLSPLAGLAVCLVLESLHLPAQIKWPNDVLISQRKTCGILAESVWQDEQPRAVVVGIGINVAPSSVPPADQVQYPATCVEVEYGAALDRWDLLRQVLRSFFEWRLKIGTPEFIQAWNERLAFKGELVYLSNSGGDAFSGILEGIDSDGKLRLRLSDGAEKLVSVGDVHLRPGVIK